MGKPTFVCRYRGHSEWVSSLEWSMDGTSLISASADGTVHVWESFTGQTCLIYRGHTNGVDAVARSSTGEEIASGSRDKTVQIWKMATGEQRVAYRGHAGWVRQGVRWSPDGTRIASGSWDRTVQIWDVTRGHTLLTYRGHRGIVYTVAWSPEGRFIASGGGVPDNTVQVWEATTGTPIFIYRDHPSSVHSVSWSPDGQYLASAGLRSEIRIWEAMTGKLRVSTSSSDAPLSWFSGASGTMLLSAADKTIEICEPTTGKCVFNLRTNMKKINALAWSPDGQRIAFGGYNKLVEVWEI